MSEISHKSRIVLNFLTETFDLLDARVAAKDAINIPEVAANMRAEQQALIAKHGGADVLIDAFGYFNTTISMLKNLILTEGLVSNLKSLSPINNNSSEGTEVYGNDN